MYCRSLIVLAAMAGLWPNLLVARSYYVSTSGNDQWPGTIEKPFASLSFQAGRLAPGADVIVMEGTYLGPVRIDLAGTAAKPISISAAKGATVIIDGSKTDAETDLVVISGKHVVFEGFEVRNAQGSGITLWGTEHVTVRNNTVHASHKTGIWVGHETRGVSQNNLVEFNVVYGNVLENKQRDMERLWASGIEISASDNSIVRRNKTYKNYGEGISVMSSIEGLVEENLFYDNYSVNIYLDNAQDIRVLKNTAGTSADAAFYRDGEPAYAASIGDKEAPIVLPSKGNIIADNRWVGGRGVFIEPDLIPGGVLLETGPPNRSQPGLIRLEN
ncbi:right-handed parallel beta-helix repeat-containing protein (plasmid) [Gemmobacter fulvus]|uniref:Right-handed parallel beta-helix repeat-containing protein n=1 Tax=Gemmobacter fulvus TaxID=2840474 RepID=A0A975PB70_9RHOB|nr:right-handed parallel beta-helix repeat-containing protein [Gemmobacter fulvus]MBT9246028.1 right-handed parallel beta-helix repeat-containing protein [Gemmobacter fulvus]QWK92206.1 right-handed parallel beta-helix repeat-containing protein [Gemmobacter fulvus]